MQFCYGGCLRILSPEVVHVSCLRVADERVADVAAEGDGWGGFLAGQGGESVRRYIAMPAL